MTTSWYLEDNGRMVLVDEDRERIYNTIKLCMPQYRVEDLKSTDRPIENFMFVDSPEWLKWKQDIVREFRNQLLQSDVDPIVSNPLRWSDMPDEEKNKYKEYRLYLVNYTDNENWWLENPKSFNEYYNIPVKQNPMSEMNNMPEFNTQEEDEFIIEE